nr:F-box/kelch-repeat protein At3g23880-like [Ipomoea batatas]
MEIVVHIPIEIIRCMLLKLNVKALIRCQSVCKEWRSIIQDDPDFKLSYRGPGRVVAAAACDGRSAVTYITNTLHIKTLFKATANSSFLNTTTRFPPSNRWFSGVWCSCNGLVLFSVGKHILLWNPSTRCCAKVLELQRLLVWWVQVVVSGLCFVPSTGDYKAVVCLSSDTVFVASLKNKDWHKVLFPYDAESITDCGVNFHNTLHWRVIDLQTGWNKIVYFDPESDEFKELPIPGGEESSVILGMGIINDCLCVALEQKELIQVLVMKEYGVEKSWVTEFNISLTNFEYEIFSWGHINLYSLECNTKVFICNSFSFCLWEILVYDLKNNTLKPFFTESVPDGDLVGICSYILSIVSPHEFIWRDNDDQHNQSKQEGI